MLKKSTVRTSHKPSKKKIIEIFSNIKMFSEIAGDPGLLELISENSFVEADAHVYLMKAGEWGNTMYVLLDGVVEVLVKSISGDEFVVAVLSANMKKAKNPFPIVGEIALLNKKKRTATIKSRTNVKFMMIEVPIFLSVIQNHPHIGLHIYKNMCEHIQTRLEKSNQNVATLFEAYVDEIIPHES